MRLLIFLVLSRYGLACKYGIISQIWIYNWLQNCIFWYLWYCIFIFFQIKLQLKLHLNMLLQVRWFCQLMSLEQHIISGSNLTQNIIRETIKVHKKRDGPRILTHSRVNDTCRIWLKLLGNSKSSTTKKRINQKKLLIINNIKLNFVRKTSSMLYPADRHLKHQGL